MQRNATWVRFLVFPAFITLGVSMVSGQEKFSMTPRSPDFPQITSVDQILPHARLYARGRNLGSMLPALELKGGEKVLLVTDSTIDPLVTEALTLAIREVPDVELNVINLHGFPEITDATEVLEKVFLDIWWPAWVWDAARGVDIIVPASRFTDVHLLPTQDLSDWPVDEGEEWPRYMGIWERGGAAISRGQTKWIRMPYVTRELMYSDQMAFPLEIFNIINKTVWQQLVGAKTVRITSPLGTDLTLEIDPKYWEEMAKQPGGLDRVRGPGHISLDPARDNNLLNGTLVVNALHTGFIPWMTLTLEDSQVVDIQGGGAFAESLMKVNDEFKDIHYPGYRNPGINWVEEISLGTNPKAIVPPNFESLRGGAMWWGGAQRRKRSGVLHVALGTSAGGRTLPFVMERGLEVQHRDTELFDVTYVADGKVIVKDGHLMALDDPEVRRVAAKYGDPDELLTEDWIPDREGR